MITITINRNKQSQTDPVAAAAEIVNRYKKQGVLSYETNFEGGFLRSLMKKLLTSGCPVRIEGQASFDIFDNNNGRITLPAAKLCATPALDTSMDVEISGIHSGIFLKHLTDFYPQDQYALAIRDGDIVSVKLSDIATGCYLLPASQNTRPQSAEIQSNTLFDGNDISFAPNENTRTNDLSAIFILGEEGYEKERYGFGDLVRIITRLTAADGCPWDRVQTHESIANNLIEEAYEAAAAILTGNKEEMCEEFGDVMLQTVLNCDIAARSSEFTLSDCIDKLCKKLYYRHTHIFGSDKAGDEASALGFWEKAKAKEKNYAGAKERIDLLPKNLPSLLYAQKTLKAVLKERPVSKTALTTEIISRLQSLDGATPENSKILLMLVALYSISGGNAETDILKDTLALINSLGKSEENLLELMLNSNKGY